MEPIFVKASTAKRHKYRTKACAQPSNTLQPVCSLLNSSTTVASRTTLMSSQADKTQDEAPLHPLQAGIWHNGLILKFLFAACPDQWTAPTEGPTGSPATECDIDFIRHLRPPPPPRLHPHPVSSSGLQCKDTVWSRSGGGRRSGGGAHTHLRFGKPQD